MAKTRKREPKTPDPLESLEFKLAESIAAQLEELRSKLAATGDRDFLRQARELWDKVVRQEPLPGWIEAADEFFAPHAVYVRIEALPPSVQEIARAGIAECSTPLLETSFTRAQCQTQLVEAWEEACALEPSIVPFLLAAQKPGLGDMLNLTLMRRLTLTHATGQRPILDEIPITRGETQRRIDALRQTIEIVRNPGIPFPTAFRLPRVADELERLHQLYERLAEMGEMVAPEPRKAGVPRTPGLDLARTVVPMLEREGLARETSDYLLAALCRIFAGEETSAQKLRDRVRTDDGRRRYNDARRS